MRDYRGSWASPKLIKRWYLTICEVAFACKQTVVCENGKDVVIAALLGAEDLVLQPRISLRSAAS